MDILPEKVTKCLCNSGNHNFKGEASCSGLRLVSFELKKSPKRKGIPTRRARAALGSQGAVKISFICDRNVYKTTINCLVKSMCVTI